MALRSSTERPVILTSLFHTSSIKESRIKRSHVHKPFFHVKKTAKHQDEPLTLENKQFVQEMIKQSYGQGVQTYIRPSEDNNSPLKDELKPWSRGTWEEFGVKTRRIGILGRKIGVVPMWFANGKRVSATMLHIEDNHVIKYIPPEDFAKTVVAQRRSIPRITSKEKGIDKGSLVVGALSTDPQKFTKDYCGLFTNCAVMPKKLLVRFPVSDNALVQPGTPLNAGHFQPGQFIDVIAKTSRRGFQGAMKRHGYSGMPSDERGCTKSHRRPGNIGSGRKKHRVWPGQKMPGHVGGIYRTMAGLQILRINYKHNVIYVLGQGIPGEPGEMVKIFDSNIPSKRHTKPPRFFPTCYPEQYDELPYEEYAEGVFKFTDPSISY